MFVEVLLMYLVSRWLFRERQTGSQREWKNGKQKEHLENLRFFLGSGAVDVLYWIEFNCMQFKATISKIIFKTTTAVNTANPSIIINHQASAAW